MSNWWSWVQGWRRFSYLIEQVRVTTYAPKSGAPDSIKHGLSKPSASVENLP
jgi:hypothetical protein